MPSLNRFSLIAPCGMNCGLCMAYLREKNKCPGCRGMNENTPGYCRKCNMRICYLQKGPKAKFCSECESFPCNKLKHLDKRYRTKYNMSMIDNLAYIKEHGIKKFVAKEKKRWACPDCGGTICVHRSACSECNKKLRKSR